MLQTLFIEHLGQEKLYDYRCDSCGTRGRCHKETVMIEWPPVLVISLKRFASDYNTGLRKKITRHIGFEEVLPLGRGEATYHLRAVVMHQGSYGSGHYTAFIRSNLHDEWYHCNDSAQPRIITDAPVMDKMLYLFCDASQYT